MCRDYNYCQIVLPNENKKTLNYRHGKKSVKFQLEIYGDFESLLEKQDNLEQKFLKRLK